MEHIKTTSSLANCRVW